MYAVIQTGGKQYRVSEGLKLKVEKLDVAEGDSIELDKVLMVANGEDIKIGTPWSWQESQNHQVQKTQASHGASGTSPVLY